jgi:hypothetical protein
MLGVPDPTVPRTRRPTQGHGGERNANDLESAGTHRRSSAACCKAATPARVDMPDTWRSVAEALRAEAWCHRPSTTCCHTLSPPWLAGRVEHFRASVKRMQGQIEDLTE